MNNTTIKQYNNFGIDKLKVKVTLLALLFITFIPPAYAQAATNYQINDPQAVDGDILTYTDKGLNRAISEDSIFGVLQIDPVISIELEPGEGKPVAKTGIAQVNVNGSIKKGDYISVSNEAGKGQKATKSGYILGIALEDSSGNTQIPVALDIKSADSAPKVLQSNTFSSMMTNIAAISAILIVLLSAVYVFIIRKKKDAS